MSAFASKADIAKRPGHFRFASNSGYEMAIRDLRNLIVRFGALCESFTLFIFKSLVNFLSLRKNIKRSRWHTFGTGRLIHDDIGRGLVQGALSVARLPEVSRFGSFVEPMADWFQ